MQYEIEQLDIDPNSPVEIRIGINTGAVVAGVIGIHKFIYDLWGDAVNVASRMESSGTPGRIQVTESTYQHLKDKYILEERGTIEIKGKGEMKTYWLLGKKIPSNNTFDSRAAHSLKDQSQLTGVNLSAMLAQDKAYLKTDPSDVANLAGGLAGGLADG